MALDSEIKPATSSQRKSTRIWNKIKLSSDQVFTLLRSHVGLFNECGAKGHL